MRFNQITGHILNHKNIFLLPQKKRKTQWSGTTSTHTNTHADFQTYLNFPPLSEQMRSSPLHSLLGFDLTSTVWYFSRHLRVDFSLTPVTFGLFGVSCAFMAQTLSIIYEQGWALHRGPDSDKWTWSSAQDVAASPYWSLCLCLLFRQSGVHLYGKTNNAFV